jgi:hypothetical protein
METQWGKYLIVLGVMVILIGVVVYFFGDKLHWIGPLARRHQGRKGRISAFISHYDTMILASLLLTLIINLIKKFL